MSVLSSFTHKPFLSALFCWAIGCSGSQSPDLDKFAQRFEPSSSEVQIITAFLAGEGGNAYRAMQDKHTRAKQKGNTLLTPDVGYEDVLPLVSGVVPRRDPIPGAKELVDMLLTEGVANLLRCGLTIARSRILCRGAGVRSKVEQIMELFKVYQQQLPLLDPNFDSNCSLDSNVSEEVNKKVERYEQILGNGGTSRDEEEEDEDEEEEYRLRNAWPGLVEDLQSLFDDSLFSNGCTRREEFCIARLFAPYLDNKYLDEMFICAQKYWKVKLQRLRFIQSALSGNDLSEFEKFCLLKAAKLTIARIEEEDNDWLVAITDSVCWCDFEKALLDLVTKFVAELNAYLSNFGNESVEWVPSTQNVLNLFEATLPNSGINNFVHSERILIWYLSRDNRPLPPRLFSLLDMCEYCDPAVVEYALSTKSQVKVYSAKRYGEAPENGMAEIVQKARIDLDRSNR